MEQSTEEESHCDPAELWVAEQLELLEFTPLEAVALASARVDWHVAAELLVRGASHRQVLRILL